jgi:NAD(P)-dependent dehydrogenase (short-subunit alcohol dehydrogenase family)
MNKLDLAGRTVAITGSTGGLGSALAAALRVRKANLVLLDLNHDAVTAQAERLGGARVAIGIPADVRDMQGLEDAMRRAVEHFGRLDIVIAGAGIAEGLTTLALIDPRDWEQTIDINLNGVWRTFTAALPYVHAQRGHLLAISSMAAFVHNPLSGPYPASKAGVWAMCDTFRLELRHQGVTVGSVHPTFFQTPMVDAVLANPAALRVMSNFTGFWRLASIETVVDDTIRGIERRSAHIITPRSLRPVALAPGLLGPLIARFGFRGNAIADATTLATSAAATDQPSGSRTRDPRA